MNNSERNGIDFPSLMLSMGAELNAKTGDRWSMLSPVGLEDPRVPAWRRRPHDLGATRSWVPSLGQIVWEIPMDFEKQAYYAYICRLSNGQQIGYVRVPNYNFDKDAVKIFEAVITHFESTTDTLVLNQVDNLGGSMFQMYVLLAMLTDRVLPLPQHKIMIDDEYAALAADIVADAQAGDEVRPEDRPSAERVAYSRFVLSERAAGRGRDDIPSNPVHLEGIAEILPAKNHYTKKLVVLINELTFSAGEFLAAILQDNKRATLFGARTAGAGGCAKRIYPPEKFRELRVEYLQIRWTLAQRTNGECIERIGVHPDVAYALTEEDMRHECAGYRRALLATIKA